MIFFLFLFIVIKNEVVDANSTEICNKCTCKQNDAQTLHLDCRNIGLNHIWGEWPEHNKTIIVSYAGNNITTLEPLPETNASVEIVLSKCNIVYLIPNLLSDVKNIKFLDLSFNKLTASEISPDKFQIPSNITSHEPSALEDLNLAYNQIHSLDKDVFECMPNLKRLNLEGNNFAVLDIHTQLALSSIKSLQSLNLANNDLTDLVENAIANYTNLIYLNLSSNQLDLVPTSLIYVGETLETLILDNNPIFEFINETFLGLKNLQVLSVNNLRKLQYINANTFVPLSSLKKLSLSDNIILTDIDIEAFGVNQTIEELYINNNNLNRIDYKLLPWSKLHVLEFKDNPLQCSCNLYNITQELAQDITRSQDGPYCKDPRNDNVVQVYNLTREICTIKGELQTKIRYIENHFTAIRLSMIILSSIVVFVALVALLLGSVRYIKYSRNKNYPFATQIVYNPLTTNSSISNIISI